MPKLSVSIPHQLSRQEARSRVGQLVDQSRQQLDGLGTLDERWDGDILNFKGSALGVSVTGAVHVEDQEVRLEVDLPWQLAMFSATVKQRIEQEGRKLLESKPA